MERAKVTLWLFLLLLAGCSSGGASGPTPVNHWRGAEVQAADLPRALALLDASAWHDHEPAGWVITFHAQRFPCPGAYGPDGRPTPDGFCRGWTQLGARRIDTVYEPSVVRWELGNARCFERHGRTEDTGGRC